MHEHFLRDGHESFKEDVSICLIDKTNPSECHRRDYYWMRTLKTIMLFEHNTEETYWTVKLGLQVHKGIIQNKRKIPLYLGWNIKSNLCRNQQQTKVEKQSAHCYTSVRNFLYIAVRNLDIYTEYVNQRVKLLFVIHQISWSIKDIINRRTKVLVVSCYKSQLAILHLLSVKLADP